MSVPKLRFKEFTSKLENTKLGEMCTFTQGVQIPSSEQVTLKQDGFIRYLYIRDFFSNDFPCYVRDTYPEKVIKTDEIMMVNTGNTTGMAYMGATGVLSNNCFKIGFDHSILNNKYLFNFLTSERTQQNIRNFFNAGGQPHLGHKNIAQIDFTFPSLPEQSKIANFLTAVDEKITQLTQKYDLLSKYKKGVMQQIFSQELRFKDDDGQDFPQWEEKQLGDVADITTGSSNRVDSTVGDGAYTFFDRSQDIRTSDIYLFDCEAVIVAGEGQEFIPKHFVGKFDLHQRTYAIMNFNDFEGKYLFYYVYQNRNYFLSQAVGSTVKSLRLPMFQKMPILQPCLKEQTKIANFLTSIDDKITATQAQLDAVKQYKQGLLQKMFV